VIGQRGDADVNDNVKFLLQLCCNNALYIINTFFQKRSAQVPGLLREIFTGDTKTGYGPL